MNKNKLLNLFILIITLLLFQNISFGAGLKVWDRSGPLMFEKEFSNEDYLGVLELIRRHSIFSTPGEKLAAEDTIYTNEMIKMLHRNVILNYGINSASRIWDNEARLFMQTDIFQTLINNTMNLDDDNYIKDFDALKRLAYCQRILNLETEDHDNKMVNCIQNGSAQMSDKLDKELTNWIVHNASILAINIFIDPFSRSADESNLHDLESCYSNGISECIRDYWTKENIGYIRIENFLTKDLALELEKKTREKFQNVVGLIIDVRGNQGGTLEDALKVSSNFLPNGAPIIIRGTKSSNYSPLDFKVLKSDNNVPYEKPIIILMDNFTASAAEVFVTALKANNRAFLIGTTTFGKFYGQNIFGDDKLGLFITDCVLYNPATSKSWNNGISADLELKLSSKKSIGQEILFTNDFGGTFAANCGEHDGCKMINPIVEQRGDFFEVNLSENDPNYEAYNFNTDYSWVVNSSPEVVVVREMQIRIARHQNSEDQPMEFAKMIFNTPKWFGAIFPNAVQKAEERNNE